MITPRHYCPWCRISIYEPSHIVIITSPTLPILRSNPNPYPLLSTVHCHNPVATQSVAIHTPSHTPSNTLSPTTLSAFCKNSIVDTVHYATIFLWVLGNATWAFGEFFLPAFDDPIRIWHGSLEAYKTARWYHPPLSFIPPP